MDPTVSLILKILEAVAEEAPQIIDAVEGWVKGKKAKRVEEVRPPHAHVDDEVERLKNGT